MKVTAFLLALCLAPAGLAAGPAVSGPFAGFAFDPETRLVRPVLGVPGAAYLGYEIVGKVNVLAVSPDGRRALAALDDSLAIVSRLASGDFDATALAGGIAGATRLAWSPGGTAAVAYSPASRTAQVLKAGKIERLLEVALEGVSAVAIDDSAERILLGAEGGLYLVSGEGALSQVASLAAPAAIAVAGGDVFLATEGVVEIRDYAGKATLLPFAPGVAATGLAVSADAKRLLVAEAQAVALYDIASRTANTRIDLDFAPTMLARLGAPATFVLTAGKAGAEPLYVVDAAASPSVYFVPAGRKE